MNKKDLLLISSIFLISGSIFLFNFLQNRGAEPVMVEVSVRGSVEYIFPLNIDGVFDLSLTPLTVEIRNGSAGVIKADCPDELCIEFGFISMPGQTSICLPNQTVLSIVGETGEQEIDIFLN
ncbi:MAG: NusG domain II-containing protein [Defluviitaleaceae bacterium]|nr:NusG domain II-containing protein [Defluviitaleaceae bacterium]